MPNPSDDPNWGDEYLDVCEICGEVCEGNSHTLEDGTVWCNACFQMEQTTQEDLCSDVKKPKNFIQN